MSSAGICPPDWNLSLVLWCLSQPPFGPLKLVSDKHLTWKTSFLLALAQAKKVSELHSFSSCVCHLRGWRSCTFFFLRDFVAKTQNPSVHDPQFEEFTVPSLDDFVDSDEMNSYSALSELFVSISPELSNIVLVLRRYSFQWVC